MANREADNPRLEAALSYARRRWPVLPLYGVDENGRCECGKADCQNPGKHPRTRNGVKDATTHEATIQGWWQQWPTANVGIATGAHSGIIVLDIDPRHGGSESLRILEGQYGRLPKTPRATSGGGGEHFYLKHPGVGFTVRNTSRLGHLPGVDLKGDGGYIVAPPSLHVSGNRYQWRRSAHPDLIDLTEAPAWLLELASLPRADESAKEESPTRKWAKLLEGVPYGQRHDTAVRIAGYYVGIGREPEEIQAMLLGFASECDPPHDPEDIKSIVRDLTEKEKAKAQTRHSFPPPKGGDGEGTNFHPVPANDFLREKPEPIVWLWERFIPEGALVVLVAFMKVGKSTFAYLLVLAIARGAPFLDFPTQPGGVLILAVEEHPRDIKRRLHQFGLRPSDPIYLHTGSLTYGAETFRSLKEFIIEKSIKLVLLDTLSMFWGVTDENNNAEVQRRLAPFLTLARETNCAVLLVHHERKSGGEGGREIRGGSALFAMVDQALLLDRREGGEPTHRVLRVLGRYSETPHELVLDFVSDDYRKLGTLEELSLETQSKIVWDALALTPKTVPTLAAETSLTEKRVRKVLEALGDTVTREGGGKKGDPFTYRRPK